MNSRVTYSRLCPSCGTEKFYPNQNRLNIALKKNRPCKSCHMKKLYKENPERNRGENNPMFRKGCVEVWRQSLSAEEFAVKMVEYRQMLSKQNSGSGNPMYGKPSPKGSGHGISGRWEGCHFRSLLELQFLEWHYHKFGCMPKTAETPSYKVSLPSGKHYYPDFVRADGVVVEVKPRRLLSANAEKISAGREKFGSKFEVMTEDHFKPEIENRIHSFKGILFNERKKRSKGFEKILLHVT